MAGKKQKKQAKKRYIERCEHLMDVQLASVNRQQTESETENDHSDRHTTFCYKTILISAQIDWMNALKELHPDEAFKFFPTGIAMRCEQPTHEHSCCDFVSLTDTDPLWINESIWKNIFILLSVRHLMFVETVEHFEEICYAEDSAFVSLHGKKHKAKKEDDRGHCGSSHAKTPHNGSIYDKMPKYAYDNEHYGSIYDKIPRYADLRRLCHVRLIKCESLVTQEVKTEDGSCSDWLFKGSDGQRYVAWVHPVIRQWQLFQDVVAMYS